MFQILKYIQIFQKILQEGHLQIQEESILNCSIFYKDNMSVFLRS